MPKHASHLLHLVGDSLNPIQIRFARQRDLNGICLVEDDSFSKPYPRDLIANLLRDCQGSFLVAEYLPGTIVGYCVAAEKGNWAHLISVGVLRQYRRRGVGKALIRRLIASLSSRVNELRLEVKEGNREAIMLYKEMGFEQMGSIRNYYEDGSSAVKMLLRIDEAHAER